MGNRTDTTADIQIGETLLALRGTVSQSDLADRMHKLGWKWSQATVWKIEIGERPLRLAEAADLSMIFNQPIQTLLGADRSPQILKAETRLRAAEETLEAAQTEYQTALHAREALTASN